MSFAEPAQFAQLAQPVQFGKAAMISVVVFQQCHKCWEVRPAECDKLSLDLLAHKAWQGPAAHQTVFSKPCYNGM